MRIGKTKRVKGKQIHGHLQTAYQVERLLQVLA